MANKKNKMQKKEVVELFNKTYSEIKNNVKNLSTMLKRNGYDLIDLSDIEDLCVYSDGKLKYGGISDNIYRDLILRYLASEDTLKITENDILNIEDIHNYVNDVILKDNPIYN